MTTIPAGGPDPRIPRVIYALDAYAQQIAVSSVKSEASLDKAHDVDHELRSFLPSQSRSLDEAKEDVKTLIQAVGAAQPGHLGLMRFVAEGSEAKKDFGEIFNGYDGIPRPSFRVGVNRYADDGIGPTSSAKFAARSGVEAGKGAGAQTDKVSGVRDTKMTGAGQTLNAKGQPAPATEPADGAEAAKAAPTASAANTDEVPGAPNATEPAAGADGGSRVRDDAAPAEGPEDPSKAFQDALSNLKIFTNFDEFIQQKVEKFDKRIAETKQMITLVRDLEKRKERTPEEDADLAAGQAQLKAVPLAALQEQRNQWMKRGRELDDDLQKEFMLIYYGMNGTRENPSISFDQVEKTEMGRKYLGILDRLGHRENTRLTPEELKKLDDYLASPEGARAAGLDKINLIINQFIAQRKPESDGQLIRDVVAGMMHAHATGQDAPPALQQKISQLLGVELDGPSPNGKADGVSSTNPNSPHFAKGGLTRKQRDQLKEYPNAIAAIESWHEAYTSYQAKAQGRFTTMMTLLNSGLPIEAILLMFMALMTENEEDKLKLKMREVTVAEEFERMNGEIEYKQKKAEQLFGAYEKRDIKTREQAEPDVDWKQADIDRQLRRLNPTDFGFTSKTSAMLMQELQMQTQTYKQTMEALMATMRVFQDMVNRAVQNIR